MVFTLRGHSVTEMDTLSRRTALRLFGSALAVPAALASAPALASAAAAAPRRAGQRWGGHQPGKIFLGMSSVTGIAAATSVTGDVGLQRSFYDWDDGRREDATVAADHAANRLPWISFKPPTSRAGAWAAIASGSLDSDLRARARRYAAYQKPTLLTFHHEPTNDTTGTGAEWAAAYLHTRAVIRDEIGASKIRFVPIIGDWAFNPQNREANAGEFLTHDVLGNCAFLGVDLYQNASMAGYAQRVGFIKDFLTKRGFPDKMIGLGETGATEYYGKPGATSWWNEQWRWCQNNTDTICAVSYFNSSRNSRDGVYWPLNESSDKTRAYRTAAASAQATRLL